MVILLLLIIVGVILVACYMRHHTATPTPAPDAVEDKKLLSLTETTLAQRQRYYHRGFRQQMQYDEIQRRAEAAGDTATLEAIRLGTYDGPLPTLPEEVRNPLQLSVSTTNEKNTTTIQELKYFCIKDKGYHVIVWPKDYNHFDMVRFYIAGIEFRDNIDEYLGESVGVLEAEPTNPYDPNAIKILAHDGHHVGYVPKDMTAEVRKVANLPCQCFFYIGKRNGNYFSDCYIPRKNC